MDRKMRVTSSKEEFHVVEVGKDEVMQAVIAAGSASTWLWRWGSGAGDHTQFAPHVTSNGYSGFKVYIKAGDTP
jgi:hypothetical protein